MDDELQCPHCGDTAIVVMDNPSSVPWNDGDDSDIECVSCKKTLTVVCEVTKVEWKFVDDMYDEIKFEE